MSSDEADTHSVRSEVRHDRRVSLTIPLELLADGEICPVRTALASRAGVLVDSARILPVGQVLEVRNPSDGSSGPARVSWSWVDRAGSGRTVRLALTSLGEDEPPWAREYRERLGEPAPRIRRRPRVSRVVPVMAVDVDGRRPASRAQTIDVSELGVGLLADQSFEPGMVVRLTRPELDRSAAFRVVWESTLEGQGDLRFRLGMEALDELSDFWYEDA